MLKMTAPRLGVDVGGTFTDIVCMDSASGQISIGKILTTTSDPGDGVIEGSVDLLDHCELAFNHLRQAVHATTLVANTLIQRTGARVALIATKGFIDCLESGIENRYDLFDLNIERPKSFVPRSLRFGVSERTTNEGIQLRPVEHAEVRQVAKILQKAKVDAVAVCLLNSFRNPAAEQEVRTYLADLLPRLPVTLSSDIAPEIREGPRSSTAVANAYVQPLVQRYLAKLETRLREQGLKTPMFVMLSEGGIGTVKTALSAPIRLVESGPAAGAMAAAALAKKLDIDRALSFDMGGTTAKLCIIANGEPVRAYTTEVARLQRFKRGSGIMLKIPVIELIEIGTGGGSIAQFNSSNLLEVGPQSAGADPGPACYGLGGNEPTVTDADLVSGYIDPNSFLGGRMQLDRTAAERVLNDKIGIRLGLSVEKAAVAVQEVVNENMALAARMHAAERGEDFRRFTLIAFGGAGPVHAWRIAKLLKLGRVVVPIAAGVVSAAGLLATPAAIELSRSYGGRFSSLNFVEIDNLLEKLQSQSISILDQAGVSVSEIQIHRIAEWRYAGQAYEVQVPLPDGSLAAAGVEALTAAFETRYREIYGRTLPGGVVEAVTWRVRAQGPMLVKGFRLDLPDDADNVMIGERNAYFHGVGFVNAKVINRYGLRIGARFTGPALVEENETTTVVGPGAAGEVDEDLNLVINLNGG